MDLSNERLHALRTAVETALASPPAAAGGEVGLVRQVPDWVGRHAVLAAEADETWLWFERRGAARRPFSGQVVLAIPPGRYFVEVFDGADGKHLSTETAAASPLVAGLTYADGGVLVRVRRVSKG